MRIRTRIASDQIFLPLAALCAASLSAQITGQEVPELAALDRSVLSAMARHQVPGGSLAVARDGRLIYARGFGWADVAAGRPVEPDSQFRIASVSKPITAAAALRLVEENRLKLEEPVLPLLGKVLPSGFAVGDARLERVTARDLLQHSGGWDRDVSFDPMFQSQTISSAMREPGPASCEIVIRYMFQRRLDFAPGARAAYSNFGYCVLARVIEAAAGEPYEPFVVREILRQLGIRQMRQGRTLESDRAPREVRYYDYRGTTRSVFPSGPSQVPWPYGGYYLESMDASGAWLASAIDLVRLGEATRPGGSVQLMAPETRDELLRNPALAFSNLAPGYHYGLGWFVRTLGSERYWLHGGSMPGVMSTLIVSNSGLTWAWLFNTSLQNESLFVSEIDGALYALERSANWPMHDLFPLFHTSPPDLQKLDQDGGVVNAASFRPETSAGTWITIRGNQLASSTRSWTLDDFQSGRLPVRLDGVRVIVNGRPAPVAYISPGQLNVIAPLSPVGEETAWAQVIRDGNASPPSAIRLRPRSPSLFAYTAGGIDFAAAIHPDGTTVGDPALLEGSRAVREGDRISLFATGLMPFVVDRLTGLPRLLDLPVSVAIGGVAAVVEFSGVVSPGIQQVNIVVPSLTPGIHEIKVGIGGFASGSPRQLPVR